MQKAIGKNGIAILKPLDNKIMYIHKRFNNNYFKNNYIN